jgi:hypothetical protein
MLKSDSEMSPEGLNAEDATKLTVKALLVFLRRRKTFEIQQWKIWFLSW